MYPGAPEPAELPADAVEVGRILDAWGIKGWFKILPYSASPEALFSSRRWFLLPPERGAKAAFEGTVRLSIVQAKEHGSAVVASAREVADRNAAEGLKGARIFIARSSFPTPAEGEYYWVDLMGLAVVNREGVALGTVTDLLTTGPHQVLVMTHEDSGKPEERMVPFVDAYVDDVDLQARRITVDWQKDY
ncbi:MAG: ribosome maturation factor RimM [Pseudomonadota bacterium]|nr:ribosome maturation factor RimM [Pseudomonadota bacterium]